MKPLIVLICNKKRVHEIFFEIQTTNNVIYTLAENFDFNFRIYKIFSDLLSFSNFSSAKFMSAFVSFSNTKYFQCFVLQQPKQIKRFKSLSKICTNPQCAEPEFGFDLAKQCSRDKHCTTASMIKVPLLKVVVYLILEVHSTLFTDPT